ncbi:MAG: hypothetical protein CME60_09980 [Halobacteriovoraceae bacterium]|nr:hypothetical protein [Halobacteriovoraceae bacterium]
MNRNHNMMNAEKIFHNLFTERYRDLIPDFDQFLVSLNKPQPIGLRLNTRFNDKDEFIKRFKLSSSEIRIPISEINYLEVPSENNWGGALEHHLGHYYIQALSSLIPVLSLNLGSENDRVLDMCAAPGGKTTHLAELMNDKGVLVANEPSLGRRRILKASLSRMGVSNCLVTMKEGQNLDFPKESFTHILLDGPCSSEGTLRATTLRPNKKKDKNYLNYNKEFRKGLHHIQSELLEKAYSLLRPGGELVYSTCTYDPYENEKQVDLLLKKHSDLSLVELNLSSPSPWDSFLCDGVTEYRGEHYSSELTKTKRVYPHQLNSIGFYVSKFVKK